MYGKFENGSFIPAPTGFTGENVIISNPDAWVMEAAGYKSVQENPAPPDTLFTRWIPEYQEHDTYIVQVWVEVPRYVKLDREKLISTITNLGMGELLNTWSMQNLSVLTWWMSDLRYLRGSPMAHEFMNTFNLTQDAMENIVSLCKEDV